MISIKLPFESPKRSNNSVFYPGDQEDCLVLFIYATFLHIPLFSLQYYKYMDLENWKHDKIEYVTR